MWVEVGGCEKKRLGCVRRERERERGRIDDTHEIYYSLLREKSVTPNPYESPIG